MLIHYFGSKDGLLRAALEEARRRQLAAAREHLAHATIRNLGDLLETMWSFLSAPETAGHLRLFTQLATLSAQDPERFPGFAEATVHDWLPDLEAALRALGYAEGQAEALATIALAIERGLLLDRNATGDTERIGKAHRSLLCLLPTEIATTGGG